MIYIRYTLLKAQKMAWVDKLKNDIEDHHLQGYKEDTIEEPTPRYHMHGDIMKLITKLCHQIVQEYPTGHTECFYEKILSQHLYERSIPCITQVDCFVQRTFSQVLVGRIDMEVAHSVLLELKVAPKIKRSDMEQLWKYIRAKKASGMKLEHAAVVCFCTSTGKGETDLDVEPQAYHVQICEADLSAY